MWEERQEVDSLVPEGIITDLDYEHRWRAASRMPKATRMGPPRLCKVRLPHDTFLGGGIARCDYCHRVFVSQLWLSRGRFRKSAKLWRHEVQRTTEEFCDRALHDSVQATIWSFAYIKGVAVGGTQVLYDMVMANPVLRDSDECHDDLPRTLSDMLDLESVERIGGCSVPNSKPRYFRPR